MITHLVIKDKYVKWKLHGISEPAVMTVSVALTYGIFKAWSILSVPLRLCPAS